MVNSLHRSGEDPRATGGLVSNLPHPRVNKTKHTLKLKKEKDKEMKKNMQKKEKRQKNSKNKLTHISTQTKYNVPLHILIKIITITASTTNIHIHHLKRHSTSSKRHNKTTTAQHTRQGNTKQKQKR